MQQIERLMHITVFHFLDSHLRSYFRKIAVNAERLKTLEGTADVFPKTRMKWTILFFILFYFIPIPNNNGLSKMPDTTTWVGSLSFEGAIGIGIIAVVQWFASIGTKFVRAFLLDSVKNGIIQFESNDKSPEEYLDSDLEKASLQWDAFSLRNTLNGGSLLVISVISLPLAIWIPSQVQAAILAASVIWTLGCLSSLWMIGLFSFNDNVWRIYQITKRYHDEYITLCKKCSTKNNLYTSENTSSF